MGPTVASPFWNDGKSYIFDPWSDREGATVIHDHGHTRWAEAIFDNWQAENFKKPATFDWSDKTVYIVGRGESLDWATKHLNKKKRTGVALVLNHACCNDKLKMKDQDYAMVVDDRANSTIHGDVSGLSLIGCPNLNEEFMNKGWKDTYGFTLWPNAPLNNFMRKLYPDLPQLNEMMSVSTCAMHLAAINGAKRIVLVGHDHTDEAGSLKFSWSSKKAVKTNPYLARLSQALSVMAFYIQRHTGIEVINCSKVPMVGYDMLAKGEAKELDFITQGNLPNYIS